VRENFSFFYWRKQEKILSLHGLSIIGTKGTAAIFLISPSSGLPRPHLGSRLHVFTNQQGDHRPGCCHDDPRIPRPVVLQVLRIRPAGSSQPSLRRITGEDATR